MAEIEKKPVKIVETILRDAHQSLIATRMTTEQMLPIVDKLDQGSCICHFPGIGNKSTIDLLNTVLDPMHGKAHTVAAKGGGIDNVTSGFDIGTLELLDHILMSQNPLLCTNALRHSGCHEIGTGSTVQKNNSLS